MMKFLLALCLTSFATAVDISSDSVQGKRLLSKARSVKDGRQLDEAYYATWMTKYSMKFDGCHSVPQFERDEGMRSMLLAKFKMCPSDNCNKCPNAGEYIVEMRDFVEAYQEGKQQLNEYACESQMETCQYQCENGMYQYQNDDNVQNNNNNQNNQNNNNNNGDQNDYCYYTCMSDNNMAYCDNDNNGGNGDMNMEEMMECRQLGGDGQNNNNNQYYAANSNYQVYYVGAYCDSTGVYVDTFTDSSCTKHAPKGTYEKYSGGYSLPTVSFVGTDCISCRAPDENNGQNNNNNNNQNNNNGNNNNNQNYNYNEEVFETCERLYEDAGKCEKNMDVQYKNNGACELMHGTLARLDNAFHHKGKAAVVLAWVFGAFVLLLGSYVVYLHTKVLTRQQINLLPPLNGGMSEA